MKAWKKLIRDKLDIKKGYNICPECGSELEQLEDEIDTYKERCIKGCYCINFDTMKREY